MSLKFLIVFLISPFFVASKVDIPPDLQKFIDDLHDYCLKDRGLTEDDFNKFDITKKDPVMMCYMKCLFTRANWMNNDEVLQYDFIKDNVHHSVRHITLPELENCGTKTAEGAECEKSYNFYYCMNQVEPEDWVLI
ncbi:hypothetical protein MTP99_010519 [Tenebrio molitor]|uniref:Odorant-binding protein 2 mRNA n=1 Tax=Tenebrio molitor TaxID=7067 RepID=A0A0C5BNF4_TENMO|nr:odorant-binding protein 2 [Tenebrio molitor]KAJ3633581.1 hypothetical protein MTP99_010519 [Tenebrio molitor]CAH1369032.1 unnamed protein product [Tenebrio molitor]